MEVSRLAPAGYLRRVVDSQMEAMLRTAPAVVTEGARAGEPRRLMVITATGRAFQTTDGISVVPITQLGP